MKRAIPCLTPSPGDMLRYDADRGVIVDPCEDGWPVVAIWRAAEHHPDGEWIDPAGFHFEPGDVDLFDDLRAQSKVPT